MSKEIGRLNDVIYKGKRLMFYKMPEGIKGSSYELYIDGKNSHEKIYTTNKNVAIKYAKNIIDNLDEKDELFFGERIIEKTGQSKGFGWHTDKSIESLKKQGIVFKK